jgi:hypothetical protein
VARRRSGRRPWAVAVAAALLAAAGCGSGRDRGVVDVPDVTVSARGKSVAAELVGGGSPGHAIDGYGAFGRDRTPSLTVVDDVRVTAEPGWFLTFSVCPADGPEQRCPRVVGDEGLEGEWTLEVPEPRCGRLVIAGRQGSTRLRWRVLLVEPGGGCD